MTTDLAAVAAGFGLGSIRTVERLTAGTMNESWKLVTTAGAYAVKRVLDVDRSATVSQVRAVRALAGKGFPVPEPIGTAADEPIVVRPEGFYTAVPWIEGDHRHGSRLDLAACEALGALLGDLHGALDATLPEPGGVVEVGDRTTEAARATLHRLLDRARANQPAEPFDRAAQDWIPVRLELLDRHAGSGPPRAPRLRSPIPLRWIHGDFQHTNVLWSPGWSPGAASPLEVVAVIDWDRLRPGWPAYELARTALLVFHTSDPHAPPETQVPADPRDPETRAGRIDLVRLARFVAGYRSRIGVPTEELDAAIRQLLWDGLTGIWPLNAHYDRGDRAADKFFASGCARVRWCAGHTDEVVDTFTGSTVRTP